ncbi:MAG: hypothetical protein JWM53_7085 [bacterium]|nr:hypothetical protein [bacterium]
MRLVALCVSICAIGCGGGGGGGPADGAGTSIADLSTTNADLAQSSSTDLASGPASTDMAGAGSGLCCGQPGDPGNELGVGKYCTGFTECAGKMASVCSNLGGDAQLHFCTMACSMGGNCGTGATCQCQGGQCGCLPDSCLNMPSTC